jgi:hypothetical protein
MRSLLRLVRVSQNLRAHEPKSRSQRSRILGDLGVFVFKHLELITLRWGP